MLIVLCMVVGAPAPLVAAGLGDAEARYEQGDMAGAATLARALASAKGFALAARATLVEAIYLSPDADKQALVERAAADAEAALVRDPNHVDAQLQLAIALGQLADLEDPLSAHVNGYAKQGKALIDRALALDPDDAWAHALLGMWHLRIVARAGDALAASLYGASRKTGVELCAQAIGRAARGVRAGIRLRAPIVGARSRPVRGHGRADARRDQAGATRRRRRPAGAGSGRAVARRARDEPVAVI